MEFQTLKTEVLVPIPYTSTFPSGNVFLASLRYMFFPQFFSSASVHLVCYNHFIVNGKTVKYQLYSEKEAMHENHSRKRKWPVCLFYNIKETTTNMSYSLLDFLQIPNTRGE